MIGKYVDKLEERLASFAITRRDVETREQKCKEIEEEAKQVKDERDSLRAKIEEFRQEESELKNLLEELVQERTNLRVENEKLVEERDTLSQGAQRSRETLASLENNMKRLDAETEKWRKTAASLEHQLNSTKSSTEEIQGGVKALNAENEELKNKLDEFQGLNSDLSEQLKAKSTELSKSQQLLETKSSDLKQVQEALQLKSDELRKSEAKVKEVSEKLERVKQELESKSSEMTKLQQQSGSNKGGMFGQKDSTQKQGDSASTNKSTASDARIETLFHSKEWDKNNVTAEATEPQGNATADQTLSKSPPTLLPARTKDGERPTKGAPQTSAKRKVPLRGVRKFFSKTTGIHGVFTRSSKQKLSKREPPKTKQALAPPPKFLPKAGPKPPPDHAATMKEDNKQKVGVEPKLPLSLHGRGQPPLSGQATNKQ